MTTSSAPGRPRLSPGRPGVHARQQVIDAAASLFAERGYAATSTRRIAERAGMRQASMYYYFAGKEEILLELLQASIAPTLDRAADYLAEPDARRALSGLARADVQTLLAEPHNIGTMYLSPEIAGEIFAPFRAARDELVSVYGELAKRIHPSIDAAFVGACCVQLVDIVVRFRQEDAVHEDLPDRIAAACLSLVDGAAAACATMA